jgi:hypothetical protein
MTTNIFVALAAGCASALMFASVTSGVAVSFLLFYLAPLPLMVAALGWGPAAAAVGGAAAAAGLGAFFGIPYLLMFAVTIAAPACWLGHLALLGRPAITGASSDHCAAATAPSVEWYPVGRILLWTASLAVVTTLAALLSLGTNGSAVSAALRRGLLAMIGLRNSTVDDGIESVIDMLVTIAPAAAAIVAIMTLTLNLWLAAKITATSERLHRPWPDLRTTALPPMTLAALALALALCFTGGLFAIVAQMISAVLLTAYALVGLAAFHTLTLGIRYRALVLGCVYAVAMVFGWPMLVMAGLGLADAFFGLRRRYLGSRPPPVPLS